MNQKSKRKSQAKWIRISRKIHRTTGISLFVFFFIVSITTLLLGWKKDSGGYLLAETQQGTTSDLREWLPLDSLYTIAGRVMQDSLGQDFNNEVDRMEVRQGNGILKVTFKNTYWGLQLDGATGNALNLAPRRSDFIEDIHDGSILDEYFQTENEIFKLIYTSVMGLALFGFTLTGFWLWYGPKRMKKSKN